MIESDSSQYSFCDTVLALKEYVFGLTTPLLTTINKYFFLLLTINSILSVVGKMLKILNQGQLLRNPYLNFC